MTRRSLLTCLVGALALTFTTGAVAQTDDESTEGNTIAQPAFVDADGDGICDNVADRHALANRALRGAFGANRGRQMRMLTANLTDEQKAEVQQLVNEMKANEAARDEIHAAVGQKLQELGITLPENWDQTFQQFSAVRRLTDEQRAEVRALVESMQAEGKTRDEIHTAIATKYEEWGKAMPERFGKGQMGGRRGSGRGQAQPTASE